MNENRKSCTDLNGRIGPLNIRISGIGSMKRKFFDWNHQFLPSVGDYLIERFREEDRLDMSNVILVLSGSRALRRLKRLLLERVQKLIDQSALLPNWYPPTFLTVGSFPEELYQCKRPMACSITQQFTWIQAIESIRKEDPEALEQVFGHDFPEELSGQLELSRLFTKLHHELAAEGKNFKNVIQSLQEKGITDEIHRWEILDKIQNKYFAFLDTTGFWDIQNARIFAVQYNECHTEKEILLIGTSDLNEIQKKMLHAVSDKVTALVFAAESEKDRFDSFGCIIPESWQETKIVIPQGQIFPAANPQDQAVRIIELLRRKIGLGQEEPFPSTIDWNDFSIGTPDGEVVPFLEQRLETLGITTSFAAGVAKSQVPNRVILLADLIATFLRSRRFDDYTALIRHPDLERWLLRKLKDSPLLNPKKICPPEISPPDNPTEGYISPESYPSESYPSESYPSESYPSESYPSESFPTESYPSESFPPEEEFSENYFSDDYFSEDGISFPPDDLSGEDPIQGTDMDAGSGKRSDEKPISLAGQWLASFDRYQNLYLPELAEGNWNLREIEKSGIRVDLLGAVIAATDELLAPFRPENDKPLVQEFEVLHGRKKGKIAPSESESVSDSMQEEMPKQLGEIFSEVPNLRRFLNERQLPIPEWCPIISDLFCEIYSENDSGDHEASDNEVSDNASSDNEAIGNKILEDELEIFQIETGFEALNGCLDDLDSIPKNFCPPLGGSVVFSLLVRELRSVQVQTRPHQEGLELVGWLDLLLDDALNIIISGMNEGYIPSMVSDDLFFPDSLRQSLNLNDNRRRLARDSYELSAIIHSHPDLGVTFGKRTLSGDSLLPGRFLFTGDDAETARRVCRFFDVSRTNESVITNENASGESCSNESFSENAGEDKSAIENDNIVVKDNAVENGNDVENGNAVENVEEKELTGLVDRENKVMRQDQCGGPTGGNVGAELSLVRSREKRRFGFRPPVLHLPGSCPTAMRVTEFGDFLACPYRYFLRHQLKLEHLRDDDLELSAASFGSIVHEILQKFGEDASLHDLQEAEALYDALSLKLDHFVHGVYPKDTSPMVPIQAEQIRSRLRAFADWQVQWRQLGNEIKFVEKLPRRAVSLDVDGQKMILHGRIDRIDYNRQLNAWFVFDYKTFNDYKIAGRREKNENMTGLPERFAAFYSCNTGNTTDTKHRARFRKALSGAQSITDKTVRDEKTPRTYEMRWTNLQLPLYRHLLRQILREEGAPEPDSVQIGYLVLPNGKPVHGLGAPWNNDELADADETARRVIRIIRRLWEEGVDPDRLIDTDHPEWGTLLNENPPAFTDVFAPITYENQFIN